jgi:hypothetical protein
MCTALRMPRAESIVGVGPDQARAEVGIPPPKTILVSPCFEHGLGVHPHGIGLGVR